MMTAAPLYRSIVNVHNSWLSINTLTIARSALDDSSSQTGVVAAFYSFSCLP